MEAITVVQFDDNGGVWVWTSPTSAHQMYKIERELYRHVNTPNFAKQLDEIDIAKQQPCVVQHLSDRWARGEIVDTVTTPTGQLEIMVSLWDLGETAIVPEYKCCPMPVSLRDIPHLSKLLSLDSIVPCLYHTPGVSWDKNTMNELYKLVGLTPDSGPVPAKAEMLLGNKVVLHVISKETDQLVNFNHHLIEQGLANADNDNQAELVKNISSEVYMDIPMKETLPIIRSLMFSKFPNSICKKLTGLGFPSPTIIQQYGWPYLMSGHSCVLVSPSRTGKTLAYLLPLLSHLLMLNTMKSSHWPPAIIVTSSSQEAIRIDALARRILSWQTAHYRCCCYYHGNESEVIIQLLNGCMLVVTTLPLLLQLLNGNHLKLNELKILVVDECNKVFDGGHKMEELMKIWACHHDNSNCGQQLIMSCSRVTERLHKFVMDYMKGSVKLIACAIESVIWCEVPMAVQCCHDNQLDNELLKQLNEFRGCGIVMVTTNSMSHSSHVTELLTQHDWPVVNLGCAYTKTVETSIFVSTSQLLLSSSATQLPFVNHLILYMLPSAKSELKRCLATLYPAITAKLNCSVTLLLAGDYKTQVVTIATMLKRMQVPLPQHLDNILQEELKLREESAMELCHDVKAWGSCNKLGCGYAHTITHSPSTQMTPPHIELPTSGTIKFHVDHVTSAGQYWARPKEHFPVKFGDKSVVFPPFSQLIQLHTDLAEYYADCKPPALKSVNVGHCYGFCDEQKVYHRVQILQLSEPLDGTMYFHKEKAKVQLIDSGSTRIVDANQIWSLPENFKTIPRQAIEIFMHGVKPAAGNGSWSSEADHLAHCYFHNKVLHGNIVFSHGNTLWLDAIEERVVLEAVAVTTPVNSLKTQLLQMGLAETNTAHLQQLKSATSNSSEDTTVIKLMHSELPVDGEYVDVYLSAVDTPAMFYVQRTDNLDKIDSLVDQLNDHSHMNTTHHASSPMDTGQFCVAQFPADNKWYRGVVEKYNKSDKKYHIFFVDFGDYADVHRNNIQPISEGLLEGHKFYAIQCSLANVRPSGGSSWSSVSADKLWECGRDKQLVAKVIRTLPSDTDRTHYIISLFDTTGPNDVSMATMLVEQRLARHCDPDVFVFTTALEGNNPTEQLNRLHKLQAKVLRRGRSMKLDKQDIDWLIDHLCDLSIPVKQQVLSLLAHLTVSQAWLKQWLAQDKQHNRLEAEIKPFCEDKSQDRWLWNNFLKMLTASASKNGATDKQDKEEEDTVVETTASTVTNNSTTSTTMYGRVYLPETDTSSDGSSSDSCDDYD
ncbi:putative ATP-dependent RNA helicase TDRD12 isoform X2 [Dysidea avara]|uniref:putative ATP-dependent RNA helicase TDRD12 isoform X2 n=1 Tax=Dysidea avara TaxID=196820 RepID=UPI00331AD7F3